MTQAEEKPIEIKEEGSTDADGDETSLMNQKLIAQIEYYFGDVNLPRDRFIKEECSKNDGWFPVATLLKFNRVVNILRSVQKDKDNWVKTICEALKPSELIDVNDESQKIRRSLDCPLPEKDTEERTIYMKGFHKTETTLDDLLEFFKAYEGVESVIMRYYKEKTIKTEAELKKEQEDRGAGAEGKNGEEGSSDVKKEDSAKIEPQLVWVRKFKGSILVVFKTIELAKKVLDDTNIVFQGTPMTTKMWQTEYKALKTKEYQEKLASRKRKSGATEKKEEAEEKEEETKEEIPKGALVKLLNIPEGFTREIIKEKWYGILDKDKFLIAFIDFNKGDKNAVLRLERQGAGNEALEKIPEKKLKMKDEDVFSEMEGFGDEEETKYMEEIKRQRETMKKRKPAGGRGGGRGGGRFGKRRRRY